ncbi:MAG: hypothetical protein K6343_02605 [Caldisericaceae bacterium]
MLTLFHNNSITFLLSMSTISTVTSFGGEEILNFIVEVEPDSWLRTLGVGY